MHIILSFDRHNAVLRRSHSGYYVHAEMIRKEDENKKLKIKCEQIGCCSSITDSQQKDKGSERGEKIERTGGHVM